MDLKTTKQINALDATKVGQRTTKAELKTFKNVNQNEIVLGATFGLVVLGAILWFWLRSTFKPEPELTKSIDENGYVLLSPINEFEHRYIAKKRLGRDLAQDEIVHHINGKKADNEIGNLCLMDREKHEHFHSWLRWKKEKDGGYPSFSDQKRVLVEEYGGTLLENLSSWNHVKRCPGCNSPMVLRTARKGKNNGKQFWGCSRYPKCRSSVAA
jgi:hypothetical protein